MENTVVMCLGLHVALTVVLRNPMSVRAAAHLTQIIMSWMDVAILIVLSRVNNEQGRTMTSTKDAILDLLTEVEKPLPPAPVKRREVADIPDALVLCVVKTVCKGCHTIYNYPNPHVLGRYGRNHKRIRKWSSLFEMLPRERLNITEEAVVCQNCFESCIIRTENIEGSVGEVT